MIPAIFSAALGVQSGRRTLDRAAADVANVNTVGYRAAGHREPQGAIASTGNPLDVAVEGDGWFRVALHNGQVFGEILYTRAGDFHRDAEGYVVTGDGRYVVGLALDASGQPTATETRIQIPPSAVAVAIGADGTVSATDAAGVTTRLAAISLARFPNPEGLEAAGSGLYRASPNSGAEQTGPPGTGGLGAVAAGALETSNVDLSESIVQTLLARSAVAASARTLAVADDVLDELIRGR